MTEMQLDPNKLPARDSQVSRLSRTHAPHVGPTWKRQVPGPHLHTENSARQEAEFPEPFPTDGSLPVPAVVGSLPRACQGGGGGPSLFYFILNK